MLHVAVVMPIPDADRRSGDSERASFVGHDRDHVIRKALVARKKWGPGYGVFVGILTLQASTPEPQFELTPVRDPEELV